MSNLNNVKMKRPKDILSQPYHIQEYINYLERNVVLDSVSYCRKTVMAVFSWIESDKCKIVNTAGNEIIDAEIDGEGLQDHIEKYCS